MNGAGGGVREADLDVSVCDSDDLWKVDKL